MYNIVFSPNEDKVAWYLAFEKQHTVALWLSRIDGSRMHVLQSIKLGADDPPDIAVQPYSVQWTPDGKSVSYVFDYRLYTVPAK